jgi:dTDP-4-amino-4,6-dideoxygalactose transaminase
MWGYNYRLTDVQAAIGRAQLKRLPALLEHRRAQARRYSDLLGDVSGLRLPTEPEWARSNWQSYCVRLPPGSDQRAVMQFMLDQGVATRRGVMCAHREPAYADCPRPYPLIESERAQDECILLPLFHQMTDEEQQYVAETLKRALICC